MNKTETVALTLIYKGQSSNFTLIILIRIILQMKSAWSDKAKIRGGGVPTSALFQTTELISFCL